MTYARDHLACSSWHWYDIDAMPFARREWCRLPMAHFGDHEGPDAVRWANKRPGVWSDWLKEVVNFGLMHLYDDPELSDMDKEAIAMALQIVEDNR